VLVENSLPCLYTIVALPSGRATMTRPMIFMLFLLRAMIPMVSSSGTPGAQIGAKIAVAICHSLTRFVEAWVGVPCRGLSSEISVSRRALADSCKFSQSCQRMSIYDNARRTSVAGFVVPSTRAVPNSTIGGQINTTFLVEFLLNCGIRGRW